MRLIQPVRPALEMSGELLDRVEIRRDGRGREVTALELLQHDAATMGHKTPPVTHTLPGGPAAPHAERPPRQRLGPNAAVSTAQRRSAPHPSPYSFADRCSACQEPSLLGCDHDE